MEDYSCIQTCTACQWANCLAPECPNDRPEPKMAEKSSEKRNTHFIIFSVSFLPSFNSIFFSFYLFPVLFARIFKCVTDKKSHFPPGKRNCGKGGKTRPDFFLLRHSYVKVNYHQRESAIAGAGSSNPAKEASLQRFSKYCPDFSPHGSFHIFKEIDYRFTISAFGTGTLRSRKVLKHL